MHATVDILLSCWSKCRFNLWDDVTSSDDADLISDLDAQSFNFAKIVQGGILHSHASNTLGGDSRNRSYRACSACLPNNIEQYRNCFFWRKFPCKCPSGMVRSHTKQIPFLKIIDLENKSINFKGVRFPLFTPYSGLLTK
tara:strand:+ start:144 stop:563 length:420 start_codon:yes stop_codon:yes gene_type:complete